MILQASGLGSAGGPAGPADLRQALARVVRREHLGGDEMARIVGEMLARRAPPAQAAALLTALAMKGETADELAGAARALRASGIAATLPLVTGSASGGGGDEACGPLVDTCGTGGDGSGTLNVSTMAALLAAACGVRIAKHGSRAQSSRGGSADLLAALGVALEAPAGGSGPWLARCLAAAGICFLYSPAYYGAARAVAEVRQQLGLRTIFNALGPLVNPLSPRRQVVGVSDAAWVEPMGRALGALGAERALVIHGRCAGPDGRAVALDEMSPDGETVVAEWGDGALLRRALRPADFGLASGGGDVRGPGGLWGGDARENAARARAILQAAPEEQGGAAWRAVVMTAAGALYVAAAEDSLPRAAARAEAALRAGRAWATVEALVRASNQ